jgi:hypothetical protein
MNKVRQKILIAIKLGRIKIKIDKSWSLPFSIYCYQGRKIYFSIKQYYLLIEILFLKLHIIFCICEE